ncbi:hypothetical protein AB0H73_10890 [Streptomyces olivoreticuli]
MSTTDTNAAAAGRGEMFVWGRNRAYIVSGFDRLVPGLTPPDLLPARGGTEFSYSTRKMAPAGSVFDSQNGLLYQDVEDNWTSSIREFSLQRSTGFLEDQGKVSGPGLTFDQNGALYSRSAEALYLTGSFPGSSRPFRDYRAVEGTRTNGKPLEKAIGRDLVRAFDVSYNPGPPPVSHVYAATAGELITFKLEREADILDTEPAADASDFGSYNLGGGWAVGVALDHRRVFVARETNRGPLKFWPTTDVITRLSYPPGRIEPEVTTFDIPAPWVGVGDEMTPRFGFVRQGGVEYACYPVVITGSNGKFGILCFDTTANAISRDDVIELSVTRSYPAPRAYPVILSRHLVPGLLCVAVTGEDMSTARAATINPKERTAVSTNIDDSGRLGEPIRITGGAWVND